MTAVQERETEIAPPRRRMPRALKEIIYIIAFWLVYTIGSLLVEGRVETAFRHAREVWRLERLLHLPNEASIQALLLVHPALIRPANFFYANVHFTATGIFLFWLYRRRPEHYLWARRVLALLTGLALATYLFFPLAPPRMLPGSGLLDLAAIYGPNVYDTTPGHHSFENVYAAMPSAHVGWSTFLAIGLIMVTRSRWRWLWVLLPPAMAVAVVATANHYVLDAVAGVTLVLLAHAVVLGVERARERRAGPSAGPVTGRAAARSPGEGGP